MAERREPYGDFAGWLAAIAFVLIMLMAGVSAVGYVGWLVSLL